MKPIEPVRITADGNLEQNSLNKSFVDVASMAQEAEKEELKKDIVNMGQYTGATLEGGEARLSKFARFKQSINPFNIAVDFWEERRKNQKGSLQLKKENRIIWPLEK